MRRYVVVGVAVAVMAGIVTVFVSRPPTIEIVAGTSLQRALDPAPDGAILMLAPGVHEGPITVTKPVILQGEPGAVISAPLDAPIALAVRADDVQVQDVTITGGIEGISIREAEDVAIRDVLVMGSNLHGIEVVDASAHISGVRVEGMRSEYSQGIEVRYADNHPVTVVENSSVVGAREGIVSHVARVDFSRNFVSETTLRAVAITEMSHGVARDNRVEDAFGAGLYCGDMSMCDFSGNEVTEVASMGTGTGSAEGWGLVVSYRSRASTSGDSLAGESGPSVTYMHSLIRDRSVFDLGAGWGAVPKIILTTLIAAALLLLLNLGARRALGRLPERWDERRGAFTAGAAIVSLLIASLVVQSFHLLEHVLQVYRVHVDGVPSKGGIVGPIVEAEWIHFFYNATVFAGIVIVAIARVRGWRPGAALRTGDSFLATAVAVQGYHVIEHTTKLHQHLTTGSKVNPGLAGAVVDLPLFHYGINLVVYVAFVGAAVIYLRRARAARAARRFVLTVLPRDIVESVHG